MAEMSSRCVGLYTIYHEEIGSTQDALIRQAGSRPDGTVLIAGRQTSGRGRMGRSWASPPGTLTFSVLLRPDILPAASGMVMLAAAISLYDTLKEYAPIARLEWPNDVMANGKLAGIIIDSSMTDVLEWVVVGVGVNMANDPHIVAKEMAHDNRFSGSDSIHLHSEGVSAYHVLAKFLAHLGSYYHNIGHHTDHIISEYRRRCWNIGRPIRRGDIQGTAQDIDYDGALLVNTGSETTRVLF